METCIITSCTLYDIWNKQTKLSYSSRTTDYNKGNSKILCDIYWFCVSDTASHFFCVPIFSFVLPVDALPSARGIAFSSGFFWFVMRTV